MLTLPTPEMERWKYTNLAPVLKEMSAETVAPRIRVQNGENLVQEMTGAFPATMPGMALWTLADVQRHDGIMIDVPAGKRVDKPVQVTI